MNRATAAEGLVALVADRDMEETLTKLFHRAASFGVRPFDFEIRRHPARDAGCRVDAVNFLRQFLRAYSHALVVFDRDGCGSASSREEIEGALERELARNGWKQRARVVVIKPELEAWVWSGSSVVSNALGWGRSYDELRGLLDKAGLWGPGLEKPGDPKQAMIRALRSAPRASRRRRSPRIFGEIAGQVSTDGCRDSAFRKLRSTLKDWFPGAAGDA